MPTRTMTSGETARLRRDAEATMPDQCYISGVKGKDQFGKALYGVEQGPYPCDLTPLRNRISVQVGSTSVPTEANIRLPASLWFAIPTGGTPALVNFVKDTKVRVVTRGGVPLAAAAQRTYLLNADAVLGLGAIVAWVA